MKKQNTNSEKQDINLPNHTPDLSYEQTQEFDEALRDYLDICMEIYWQKVADGSFPWPDDGSCGDNTDSTL